MVIPLPNMIVVVIPALVTLAEVNVILMVWVNALPIPIPTLVRKCYRHVRANREHQPHSRMHKEFVSLASK